MRSWSTTVHHSSHPVLEVLGVTHHPLDHKSRECRRGERRLNTKGCRHEQLKPVLRSRRGIVARYFDSCLAGYHLVMLPKLPDVPFAARVARPVGNPREAGCMATSLRAILYWSSESDCSSVFIAVPCTSGAGKLSDDGAAVLRLRSVPV
jgi:hypothetical protein